MELEKFDLEKAKAGRKVVTRSGLPVDILKWDARGKEPLVGIIEQDEEDVATSWEIDGRYHSAIGENSYDLFLSPEERYVNLYEDASAAIVHDNLKEAQEIGLGHPKYLGTYKLVKV